MSSSGSSPTHRGLQATAHRTRVAGWPIPLGCRAPAWVLTLPARPPWSRPIVPTKVSKPSLCLFSTGSHAQCQSHVVLQLKTCATGHFPEHELCELCTRMARFLCLTIATCRHCGWRVCSRRGWRHQRNPVARPQRWHLSAAGVLLVCFAHPACCNLVTPKAFPVPVWQGDCSW